MSRCPNDCDPHAQGCPALDDVRDGCACLLPVAAQGDHYPECPCARWPGLRGECLCSRLRACEARVFQQGVEQGQRDEREACIAAITPWLPHSSDCNIRHFEGVCDCECAPIVAAIRAREEKP